MPANDPAFYVQALRRISWMILAIAVIGTSTLTSFKGFRMGLAFLIGGIFSYVSFWGWQHVVMALSPGSETKQKPWRFVVRIALLGAAACALITLLGLNVAAAVTGLLVSGAAVILELIYELIHARA